MMSLKKIDQYKHRFNESSFKKKTMPKILSVLFAIIFWFYVMDQVNPEMTRTIANLEVEILNQEGIQSGGYVILDQQVPAISVKITGRRKAVMSVKAEDIILSADLKDFHKGTNYFSISKKIFVDNVTIEDLSENRIQMTIDRMTESAKAVTLKTTGKLPEGESLGEIKLSPEQVVVRGPESYVKLVAGVVGEVDLGTVQNNAIASVSLKAVDQNGQPVSGVTLSSTSISATLGVLKENMAEINADFTGSPALNHKVTSVTITPSSVSLKGQADSPLDIKTVKTQPIDLTGFSTNQDLNVGLVLPQGVQLEGVPEFVRVQVSIEPVEEKEMVFSAADIKWFNLPSGLRAELPDPERRITVKVKAVASVLEALTASDLQLEADGGELKEGLHKVKVSASSNLETEALTVVPATIDVEGVKN